MEKLNFDIEKYQSLTPDEKVEALSKIFFKYLDESLIVENAQEELIENIYDETIYKITNLFRREQGEIDYEITSYEDGGVLYYSKIRNNYISEIDYRNLKNLPNSFRFKFQFRKKVYGENKGTIDTQTIGYKVFSNFRNRIQSKKKVLKPKLSNPEKIAVLYEIGIESTLNKFSVTEDKYRFIHELIGGDYSNIKKVMISGVSNQNKRVALDFINSKTI